MACNVRDASLRSSENQSNIKDNVDYGVMVKLSYPVKIHSFHFKDCTLLMIQQALKL